MRYDDPERPLSDLSATKTPLQVNGSPLPTITLMYPMQNGGPAGAEDADEAEWGWLVCIHAHRSANKFGTYYGWVRDLASSRQTISPARRKLCCVTSSTPGQSMSPRSTHHGRRKR